MHIHIHIPHSPFNRLQLYLVPHNTKYFGVPGIPTSHLLCELAEKAKARLPSTKYQATTSPNPCFHAGQIYPGGVSTLQLFTTTKRQKVNYSNACTHCHMTTPYSWKMLSYIR